MSTISGLLGQCLHFNKFLLFKTQIKKLSNEPWLDDSALILFTVPLKFVSGNFYGLSFMYWIVKSSALSNWKV
jgi:hypothetical protein